MNTPEPTILLVEDEPTLQFVFEKQIQKLGYKVSAIADNGLSAVEKVIEQSYHLVFMDIRLPGIDGITATERIRAVESEKGLQHTRIVGMTAFGERQRCMEAGMDDFLQKPVLLDQLEETIAKWMSNSAVQDQYDAIANYTPVPQEQFSKTDANLQAIQQRIGSLRKRVGLE